MTNNPSDAQLTKLKEDSVRQIGNASTLVRLALEATMPVAPEQYMTIAVPGTVIDTTDLSQGGTFVYDATKDAFIPTAVRQAEARLVDKMSPLANVMIGNTGKSVARSYATALDFLVARKATVSTGAQIRSPGEPSYDQAMKILTTKDGSGKTPVDIYIAKQLEWAKAQDAWDTAKIEARKAAEAKYMPDIEKVQQEFNDWAQQHYRRFKNEVQAHWMDWVTNGDKYNVEYNFGLVDIDSVMARIESSKESLRNSTIVDTDGANELQGVNLTPKNWATLCKRKADGYYTKNGAFSLDQVNAEISRLQKLKISLQVMQTEMQQVPPKYPKANPTEPTPTLADSNTALGAAYQALYDAQGVLNAANPPTDAQKMEVQNKQRDLATALETWENTAQNWVKYELSRGGSPEALATLIATVDSQLSKLTEVQRNKGAQSTFAIAPITGAHAPAASSESSPAQAGNSGNDFAALGDELADPIFVISSGTTSAPPEADPWTKITASYSATDQKSTLTQSSWGFSVSAEASWLLWSAGGSYSHDESKSDFQSDMANCDVSISFSALVVNIDRPWLYAELFDDYELDVPTNAKLSPGPEDMHDWMKKQASDPTFITSLALYNTFPAFPTAFLVAADTVLEFTGNTQHIERHFKSVSNTASAHFGWGPFSVKGSYHDSSTRQDFQMQTTATGVKITFAAPQIIAWVNQILPALPRKPGYEPMVQNDSRPKT